MDERITAARDQLASKIVDACGFDWDGPVTWALVDAIDALIIARLADSADEGRK